MDQCKHCTFRGNIESCVNAPCSHHDTWFAKELIDLVGKLTYRINAEVCDSEYLDEVRAAEIILKWLKE